MIASFWGHENMENVKKNIGMQYAYTGANRINLRKRLKAIGKITDPVYLDF